VLAAGRPDRVELRVVDRKQAPVLVANAQAKALVELQSLGSGAKALLEPPGFSLRPARFVDPSEVEQREGQEPPGMSLLERGDRLPEPRAPTAVEVDDRPDASRIHLCQELLDACRSQNPSAAAEVVVDVECGNGGRGNLRCLTHEHAPRLPVAELEFADVRG